MSNNNGTVWKFVGALGIFLSVAIYARSVIDPMQNRLDSWERQHSEYRQYIEKTIEKANEASETRHLKALTELEKEIKKLDDKLQLEITLGEGRLEQRLSHKRREIDNLREDIKLLEEKVVKCLIYIGGRECPK